MLNKMAGFFFNFGEGKYNIACCDKFSLYFRVKIIQKNLTLVVVILLGKREHLEVGHKGNDGLVIFFLGWILGEGY